MAQTNFTPISLYYSTTAAAVPTAGNLVAGELAINTQDGKLFYKDAAGVVQTIASKDINSGVFPAGTVSAPSITFVGDTNTGIYSPAADTIAFTEGGVEVMRITSTGRVGVGTTNPGDSFVVSDGSGGAGWEVGNGGGNATVQAFNRTTSLYTNYTDASLARIFQTGTSPTERMRIDSSGNVGIGTTSPSYRLDIRATSNAGIKIVETTNGPEGRFLATASDVQIGTYGGSPFSFYTNSAERMRIDSSGRVGIGTASPDTTTLLTVAGAVTITGANSGHGASRLKLGQDTSAISQIRFYGADNSTPGILQFTGSSADGSVGQERMRIDSSGNLLVGTTATSPGYGNTNTGVQISGSGSMFSRAATDYTISVNNNTTDAGNYRLVVFRAANLNVGNISSNGTGVTYGTASDYRLKENIVPMVGALATVAALKPVTYKWKVDGSDGQGFIAHELQELVPDCVIGDKDDVDGDGNIKPQGIDTSFLVATLTAAIQEQQALIENLTTRLNALEGN